MEGNCQSPEGMEVVEVGGIVLADRVDVHISQPLTA